MLPQVKLMLIGIFFTLLLIANLFLVGFRVYGWLVFWLILAVIAAISYFGIPRLKKKMIKE